ncbi:hypothetical protein H6G64_02160 [Calothrix sp. FACHB-156]|nr:hypothetical protein [Nostoc linckia FACHB-104]MBD2335793.1 hypothetical protein [Calothrix sp. FACHB-156]
MILIILTYHGYEKYCNYFIDYLKYSWPNHPEVWFLTDGGAINHPNVITVKSDKWLIVLYEGLKQLKNKYNDLDYTYLVLEDLLPLSPVSDSHLSKIENIIDQHQLKCVSFVVYPHKYLGNDIVTLDNIKLYQVPRSFEQYSQLQPAIWNMNHLLNICQHALDNNFLDPWSFEKIVSDEQHYVSEYYWPSVFNGFLHGKHPVWEAIWKVKTPEAKQFRNQLIKDYFSWIASRIRTKLLDKIKTNLLETKILNFITK